MNDKTPTKMVEAVHAELLSDLQKIRVSLDEFQLKVPELYKSIETDVSAAQAIVKETFAEFEGVALGLARHTNESKAESLKEIRTLAKDSQAGLKKISEENIALIEKRLAPFVKYFWLLIPLGIINVVLVLMLVGIKLSGAM